MTPTIVVICKGGLRQKNVIGSIVADKQFPPFRQNRKGYLLRWWPYNHPAVRRYKNEFYPTTARG